MEPIHFNLYYVAALLLMSLCFCSIGVNVNPEYIKSVILNQENKTKIRPILLAFNGLPKSGKSKSVSHLLKNYVDSNRVTPMTYKHEEQREESISYYELVAAGFHPLRELTITEVTKESSCAFGILSAFRKELLEKGEAPLFNGNPEGLVHVFDDSDLDGHLQYTFRHLHKNNPKGSDLSKEEQEFAQGMIKLLPEGIALINIWDVSIDARVLHCLNGFFGHLHNCHSWLFLDINRDLENLDCIPEVDSDHIKKNDSVLMTTRPRLHYLLRSSRMSLSNKYNREDVCSIFARHSTSLGGNLLKRKVTELENKIKLAAKHVGVSSLIEQKIETVVLDDSEISNDISHRLYQKFQQLIYQTPYEDVPLSWVFLRSLFYRSLKIFIAKSELKKKAKECGMDDNSFGKFCEFYTSFGSIFDLSLVDPEYLYVIVKPMGFLRSLDKILCPDKTIRHKYSAINCGIVSENACKDVFKEIWLRFMEALEAICLAAKMTSACIDISDLNRSDVYYYAPITCTDLIVTSVDPTALYLMTSLDMPHIFQPPIFAKHLLELFPNAKLIPCAAPNKMLIKDYSTSTTITIISHSPTTRIQVDQVNPDVFSRLIQACHKIANSCNVGLTKYKFIIMCAKNRNVTNAKCIPSSRYHVLPNDALCDVCAKNDRINETLKAWNKAITEVSKKFKLYIDSSVSF